MDELISKDEFRKFLEMSEDERFETYLNLMGVKLYPWQKLYIKYINKWWSHMRKMNPHLRSDVLWESIYKGRY